MAGSPFHPSFPRPAYYKCGCPKINNSPLHLCDFNNKKCFLKQAFKILNVNPEGEKGKITHIYISLVYPYEQVRNHFTKDLIRLSKLFDTVRSVVICQYFRPHSWLSWDSCNPKCRWDMPIVVFWAWMANTCRSLYYSMVTRHSRCQLLSGIQLWFHTNSKGPNNSTHLVLFKATCTKE